MELGSLFCMLRDDVKAMELDWVKRVNVVKGVANALSYMHHDSCPLFIETYQVTTSFWTLSLNLFYQILALQGY